MNLHRTDRRPQWEITNPSKRNGWQRLAAKTNGVATPGNFLTFMGFCIAVAGLVAIPLNNYWFALTGLAVGRLFDVADGYAAELTKTKSPLGEIVDATADKTITILTLIILTAVGIAPWPLMLALLILQAATIAISATALSRGKRQHPSQAGKISMALTWLGLVGLVFVRALNLSSHNVLGVVSYALIVLSVVLGTKAAWNYYKAK